MATRWLPPLTVGLLLAIGLQSSASAGVHLGTNYAGAGIGYWSGPLWPGHTPFFYDPWFYGPGFGPSPVLLLPAPDKGQVSLQSSGQDSEVYLDGAYAGTTATLKKFWLSPGVYTLEVRAKDQVSKTKRIYVLTGKTLKVSLE